MLEQLFGSKTRLKLLKLFLLNPERAYFIRELTRIINTQINSVRRELQNLLQCNIICETHVVQQSDSNVPSTIIDEVLQTHWSSPKKTRSKQHAERIAKKYFKANPSFLLFNELQTLISKGPLLYQDDLISELKNFPGMRLALLTGFFVESEAAPVDLFIVGDFPQPLKMKLTKVIHSFEKLLEREINFTTMTHEEFLYRKSLSDRFLFSILEGKRKVVVDTLA